MGNISGSRMPAIQPSTWGRSDSGNYLIYSFEGGSKREIAYLAAVFAQTDGLFYEVKEQFGKSRLDIRLPWNPKIDPTTDKVERWEMFSTRVEMDVLYAHVTTGITDNLTDRQIAKIRNLIQQAAAPGDPGYPSDVAGADFIFAEESQSINTAQDAYLVWQRMKKGIQSFPVMAPVLRYTLTTSLQYAIKASLQNVRKIISTASMPNAENVPDLYLFDLPEDTPPTDDYLVYGWFKEFPAIQQVALGKWNVTQQYQYGLWDTVFYGKPL